MSQVVTRFAPSPTGFLHIGGARTALFNWLYAKRFGGKFLLRIEDTDRERSTEAAVEAILDGLHWLGLELGRRGDQPVRARRAPSRSRRADCSPRAAPIAATRARRNSRRCAPRRAPKASRCATTGAGATATPREAPAGVKPVIRLRARQDGETIVDDKVQGKVVFANKELDDLVLLRSDGNPTYMLAVVVDDHDMGVTHIIRGDDHLTNAARQMQIYDALGWDVPVMAHIPLIHGPDGAKLSKRHGALGVDAYRAHGLSARGAAQLSRAARLEPGRPRVLLDRGDDRGVRPAGDRPFAVALRLRQAREHERPFHARDARRRAAGDRSIDALPYLPGGPEIAAALDDAKRAQLAAALPGLKERAKTLVELVDGAAFLFARRPLAIDDKAEEILARGGRLHLAALLPRLKAIEDWSAAGDRGGGARLRRRRGRQARNDRPAAARGGDRPLDLARHFRRAGGARPRGEPRPHRRPGAVR